MIDSTSELDGRGMPRAWRAVGPTAGVFAVLALAACDPSGLLDVEDPDVVRPGEFLDEEALPALHAAAIGEFQVAYVGDPSDPQGEAQILISGLVADEFIHTGMFDTRESIDRRIVARTNGHVEHTFARLHRARVSAERAAMVFQEWVPDAADHAEVQNLAGFTYLMFGENYCSGVPFSEVRMDGSLDYGEPETTTQIFERAVATFTAAQQTASAAESLEQQHLALLGEARGLLGLGEYEAAAEVAAEVPTGFEYVIFHSETTERQNNGVWSFNNSAGRWSVAETEGGNGLPFRSDGNVAGAVQDPRVPTVHIGGAQRSELRPGEHWGQLIYPERSSSTRLASGVEARLIEAEAALRQGDPGVSEFVQLHNDLRALEDGLDPFDEPDITAMSQEDRENLHFQERAYWLWLTSRRLGDLRRLLWDYGRQHDEVFPVGPHYRVGAPYGTDTNIPIPFDEENNPNSDGCLTRDDHAGRS